MIESSRVLVTPVRRPAAVEYKVQEDQLDTFVFSAGPYERGFATTLGNSLRRVLLSSVQGYAIFAVRFEGVTDEYQNIPGVYQDTLDIILNLRKVSIALTQEGLLSRVLSFSLVGPTEFYAKDLVVDAGVVVSEPDVLLLSLSEGCSVSFEVQVAKGRGYAPAETVRSLIEVQGTIPIDVDYSPIRSVSFVVEPFTYGDRSDYEKLIMTVRGKGCVSPKDSFEEAVCILKECYSSFGVISEAVYTEVIGSGLTASAEKNRLYTSSIFHAEFTIRTAFFLKTHGMLEIGQLVSKTEEDLLSKKYVTKEILEDIREKLAGIGLSLGMKDIDYQPSSGMDLV